MVATAAQIARALSGQAGPIVMTHRYTLRDVLWTELADITDWIRDADIDFDSTTDVVRGFNGTIVIDADLPIARPTVNIPGSYIGVESDLVTEGGTVRFPLGLYKLSSHCRFNLGENNLGTAEVTGLDPSVLLLEEVGTPFSVTTGQSYITVIVGILAMKGLTRFSITPNIATIPAALTWEPRTTWLRIINDLLQGINYWPLWFDMEGIARSTYRGNPEQAQFTTDVIYWDIEPRMVMGQPFKREADWDRQANQVTVTIEAISRPPAGRTARNEDGAPNGTNIIHKVVSDKVVADTASNATTMLSELAVWYVVEQRSLCTQIELEIFPDLRRNPTRALREIVSLRLGDWLEADVDEPERRYWHLVSWKWSLDNVGQPMQLVLASLLPGTYVVGDPNGPGGSTVVSPI